MYLGWPKCASSWLYDNLSALGISSIGNCKESHLWYTDPESALREYKKTSGDIIVDFSTNNWSMDSYVAKKAADLFDYFILIHRNPAEVVASYHEMLDNDWNRWQESCLTNNLCNTGDTLLRWDSIVGNKLKVYEYTDIKNHNQTFLNKIAEDLSISLLKNNEKSPNKSSRKHKKINNIDLINLINSQELLFYNTLQRKNYNEFF